jgi:hypothetical protein
MVCCGLINAQGLERTQDMHNGSLAPRSHVLAADITRRAPSLSRPRQPHTLARAQPFPEAVRPLVGRPRGDRTASRTSSPASAVRTPRVARKSRPHPFPTAQPVGANSGTQQPPVVGEGEGGGRGGGGRGRAVGRGQSARQAVEFDICVWVLVSRFRNSSP